MTEAKHTPTPYRQGITLITSRTKRWSDDENKKSIYFKRGF